MCLVVTDPPLDVLDQIWRIRNSLLKGATALSDDSVPDGEDRLVAEVWTIDLEAGRDEPDGLAERVRDGWPTLLIVAEQEILGHGNDAQGVERFLDRAVGHCLIVP